MQNTPLIHCASGCCSHIYTTESNFRLCLLTLDRDPFQKFVIQYSSRKRHCRWDPPIVDVQLRRTPIRTSTKAPPRSTKIPASPRDVVQRSRERERSLASNGASYSRTRGKSDADYRSSTTPGRQTRLRGTVRRSVGSLRADAGENGRRGLN